MLRWRPSCRYFSIFFSIWLSDRPNPCYTRKEKGWPKEVKKIGLSLFINGFLNKHTDGAYLSFTTNTTIESEERYDLFFSNHILQVLVGLANMHAFDGHSCFVRVLEVHAEVWASCFARLCWILGIGWIASHFALYYLENVNVCFLIRASTTSLQVTYTNINTAFTRFKTVCL